MALTRNHGYWENGDKSARYRLTSFSITCGCVVVVTLGVSIGYLTQKKLAARNVLEGKHLFTKETIPKSSILDRLRNFV